MDNGMPLFTITVGIIEVELTNFEGKNPWNQV